MAAPFESLPWLKYSPRLFGHPKIKMFASHLAVSERDAFYWWMGILSFCGLYSTEGDLTKYPLDQLGTFIDYDGDQELLVKAGIEAKLMDFDPSLGGSLATLGSGLRVHDWPSWHGDVLDSRDKATSAAISGSKGGHTKNHVNKGIVSPDCQWCVEALGSSLGATWAPYVHREEKTTPDHTTPLTSSGAGDKKSDPDSRSEMGF